MGNSKLKGKHLLDIGYKEGKVIGIAVNSAQRAFRSRSRDYKLNLLKQVLAHPEQYADDDNFWRVAKELLENRNAVQEKLKFELKATLPEYQVYGQEHIEPGAIHQMNMAMKLPVAKYGALMPDAHHGYGLPIGGVLATENAVIPYGVGVDIGCRMCLSVFPDAPVFSVEKRAQLRSLLEENTRFGNKEVFNKPANHEVLERAAFYDIPFLRKLQGRAYKQMGTSGGGNHFVEFGTVKITEYDSQLGLPKGEYLGLLSHSGSRGLGANIAKYYTKVAREQCRLPDGSQHLSWLNLNGRGGQEYWAAMNLAGDYASACHHNIHDRMAKALGSRWVGRVENHHNFAWKEQDADGNTIIVHRKGATPAGKGVLGVIPGSMTAPGFIVRGKGEMSSINSASHGAGRVMSRTQAKSSISPREVKLHLKEHNVETLGGGVDEAPMAYKNIEKVMESQTELVDQLGTFTPKIVRME